MIFRFVAGSSELRTAEGEESLEVKRAVVAGAAVAGIVLNGLAGFLKGINGPDNVKDVSIESINLPS